MKGVVALFVFCVLSWIHAPAFAGEYEYTLFKNDENFGIVVFPKQNLFAELGSFITSLSFKEVESGEAVMRFGPTDRDNQTYMMPEAVQKKHNIEKFVILQVLADQGIQVGIYDPQWGLTLPFAIYSLDDVKDNLPKTLDIFRNKKNKEKESDEQPGTTILWQFN